MPIALDPGGTKFDYVLKREADDDNKTTWNLTILTLKEKHDVESSLVALNHNVDSPGVLSVPVSVTRQASEIVRRGLRGWMNFNDKDGKALVFTLSSDGHVANEIIERISPEDLVELSDAIQTGGEVSETEAKNFI